MSMASIVLLMQFSRTSAAQRASAAANFSSRQLALLGVASSTVASTGMDSDNTNTSGRGLAPRGVSGANAAWSDNNSKPVHNGLVGFTTPAKRMDRWRRDSPLSTGAGAPTLSGMRARRLGLEDSAGRIVESPASLHAAMAMSPSFSGQRQIQQQPQHRQTPPQGLQNSARVSSTPARRTGILRLGNGECFQTSYSLFLIHSINQIPTCGCGFVYKYIAYRQTDRQTDRQSMALIVGMPRCN
jgi:hypothetical protein